MCATLRSQTAKLFDVTGFHPPEERTLEVTFHVLLPKEAWNWSQSSSMHMQFGHPKLGQWKQDIGSFTIKRYVDRLSIYMYTRSGARFARCTPCLWSQ